MAGLTEVELVETTDAMVWAEEFMRLFGDRREDIDAGLMVGWFANAMETAKREALSTAPDLPRKGN